MATALACVGVLTTALDLGAATLLARDGASSPGDRGALLRGLLQARAPLAVVVLVVALVVGLGLGETSTALAVALFSITGALALSVLGAYRSCQDLRPEALQRLAAAILVAVTTLVCGLVVARADVLLAGLALVTLLALVPLDAWRFSSECAGRRQWDAGEGIAERWPTTGCCWTARTLRRRCARRWRRAGGGIRSAHAATSRRRSCPRRKSTPAATMPARRRR